MTGTLDGRVAVVTGAGRGIGRGIARAVAAEGASVAAVGRTVETLEETCAQLRADGRAAEPFGCDVSDTGEIDGVVERIVATFGRVDVLVNNAYTGSYGPLTSMTNEQFQRGFFSGPFAAFAFMRACHSHLRASGDGNVVNLVTSAMVRWDQSNYGAYAAAKSSMRSLTSASAAEWGADGIRVNAVAPLGLSSGLSWWIDTYPDEAREFLATVPMGYVGDTQQDIGRAVVMLLSPGSRYLTGATIPVDGGQGHF